MESTTNNIKQVVDFPDFYISDTGRVFSTRSGSIRELHPTPDGHRNVECVRITLFNDKCRKLVGVHKLVAEAFIGPRPPGMQICHNNGDPTDNRVSNLRYGTPTDNQRDRRKHGTHFNGEKIFNAILTESVVRDIRDRYCKGQLQREIGETYGISQSHVSAITRGRLWHHVDETQRKVG